MKRIVIQIRDDEESTSDSVPSFESGEDTSYDEIGNSDKEPGGLGRGLSQASSEDARASKTAGKQSSSKRSLERTKSNGMPSKMPCEATKEGPNAIAQSEPETGKKKAGEEVSMADILDLDLHHGDDMAIDEDGEEVGIEKLKERARKRKGRGFTSENSTREVLENFESISAVDNETSDVQAQRSVEGWILIVTGIHEEAHEDDVQGRFSDFGEIKNLHLNLDRRTGFLKGYALIEYEHFKDAAAAKTGLDGSDLLGNTINVDWAFMKKPLPTSRRSRRH